VWRSWCCYVDLINGRRRRSCHNDVSTVPASLAPSIVCFYEDLFVMGLQAGQTRGSTRCTQYHDPRGPCQYPALCLTNLVQPCSYVQSWRHADGLKFRWMSASLAGAKMALSVHTWLKGKGKVFPYSLPSVGPGADPGVQAVSPQVT